MSLRTLGDINRAFDAGQWHSQRFLKNGGNSIGLQWSDSTFASGQPAYDARVGTAATFIPCVAQRNDSIFFPSILSTQERYLASIEMRGLEGTYNGPMSVVLFDLLGYYPLIDGDSTDTQAMDNTITLPRYESGDGISLVIVNHVAPAVQNGLAVIEYTNSDGSVQTITSGLVNSSVNMVSSGVGTNVAVNTGAYAISLGNGAKGIRSLDSITYTTPPGGLHCAYLIKVLGTLSVGDNGLTTSKDFTSRGMPIIKDGAWLGWFSRTGSTTGQSTAWFGNFTFVWG